MPPRARRCSTRPAFRSRATTSDGLRGAPGGAHRVAPDRPRDGAEAGRRGRATGSRGVQRRVPPGGGRPPPRRPPGPPHVAARGRPRGRTGGPETPRRSDPAPPDPWAPPTAPPVRTRTNPWYMLLAAVAGAALVGALWVGLDLAQSGSPGAPAGTSGGTFDLRGTFT